MRSARAFGSSHGGAMAEPGKRSARPAALPASSLAAAITAAPKLSAPKAAGARVDEWLGETAPSPAGKALAKLLQPGRARAGKPAGLVAAIAEASPYLWDLIRAEPDRFLALLEAD